MKIVLDTNCLLRAVPNKSVYHCILSALQQGRYKLCVSTEILMEYEELLMRFYNKPITESILSFIIHSPYTELINSFYKWNLIFFDADDNKFVDCALNSGADYLITNDKHFNLLKSIEFPKIEVIDIATFKKIVSTI
jgi:putative PIN family toxin of toxin-antitoxin system